MIVCHIEANGGTNTAQYVRTIGLNLKLKTSDRLVFFTSQGNIYPSDKVKAVFGKYGSTGSKILKLGWYVYGLIHAWMLVKKWSKKETVVLHYHWPKFSPFDALFLKFLNMISAVNTISTVHNILPHESSNYDHFFFKRIYKLNDKLIFHNPTNYHDFLSEFPQLSYKRIEIIPHYSYSVNIDKTQEIESNILFFGSIRTYKGLDILIESLGLIDSKIDWELTIAGKPEISLEEVKARSRLLGISNKIDWRLGWISESDLDHLFNRARIVILPYRKIDNSGVINLAMSYGKLIIASSVGGIQDLIHHGKNGLLVKPNDTRDLANVLEKCLDDPGMYSSLQENARNYAEIDLSPKIIGMKTLKYYTE